MHGSALIALTSLLFALGAGLAPSPASADAQRLETIALPSAKGFVDVNRIRLNKTDKLEANVLLPEGYDAAPGQAWPVLYLLPGVGDNMATWVDPTKGNVTKLAKGFKGIIVMPEAGRGYFTDWWQDGNRDNPQWERYYLEEVVPQIESRYRILPGRRNHAIGGISMGAYGGVMLAGQFPGYFGTALSLSGLLNSQAPEAAYVLPIDIGSPYQKIWGPLNSPYARAHNPIKMLSNVASTRLYVSTGDGKPAGDIPFSAAGWTSGSVSEYAVWRQSIQFSARAREVGADVTYSGHHGVHDWPYWRREFTRLMRWDLFGATKADSVAANTSWTYKTMAPRGNAWGLGYVFAAKTRELATFTRSGQSLSIQGAGTVTVNPGAADADASGAGTRPECSFTAKLPVQRTLPAGC